MSRSARQSASTSAVLPLPTGPPMPTVKARWAKSRVAGLVALVEVPRVFPLLVRVVGIVMAMATVVVVHVLHLHQD